MSLLKFSQVVHLVAIFVVAIAYARVGSAEVRVATNCEAVRHVNELGYNYERLFGASVNPLLLCDPTDPSSACRAPLTRRLKDAQVFFQDASAKSFEALSEFAEGITRYSSELTDITGLNFTPSMARSTAYRIDILTFDPSEFEDNWGQFLTEKIVRPQFPYSEQRRSAFQVMNEGGDICGAFSIQKENEIIYTVIWAKRKTAPVGVEISDTLQCIKLRMLSAVGVSLPSFLYPMEYNSMDERDRVLLNYNLIKLSESFARIVYEEDVKAGASPDITEAAAKQYVLRRCHG